MRERYRTEYYKQYKKLFFIPIIILIICLGILVYNYQTTGDIIDKDVSLKGGTTATIYTDQSFPELEEDLFPLYPMIAEAKAILNRDLLQRYKKTKITKKNLRRKKEMIISALKITKGFIEMDKAIKKVRAEETITSPDHRVVQAAVMHQVLTGYSINVTNKDAVNKSWPQFWSFIENLYNFEKRVKANAYVKNPYIK